MISQKTYSPLAALLLYLLLPISTWADSAPDAPGVLGFDAPFEITVCEDDWGTFELALDAVPGLAYTWFDNGLLDNLEFSNDRSRFRIIDPEAYSHDEFLFFGVQAIDASGCPSPPTSITLVLSSRIELPSQPITTECTGRLITITPPSNGLIESYSWDFDDTVEILSGDETDGDPFDIRFNEAGEKTLTLTVTNGRDCPNTQEYVYDVLQAPPLPNIAACEYMGPDSILFTWTEDPAYTYDVDLTLSPPGSIVDQMGTAILITNIVSGPANSSSILTVTAMGGTAPCDFTTQPLICRSCIPSIPSFPDVTTVNFCQGDPDLAPVPLSVNVGTLLNGLETNVDNPAEGTWSGAEGLIFMNGMPYFDPTQLDPGQYPIEYNYLHPEDNCPHPSGVVFTIFEDPDPNASFTSTGEIKEIDVCASEEEVTIYFDRIENFPEPSISSDVPGLDIDRDDNSAVISFPPDAETYQIMLQYNIAGCDTPLDVITLHVREEMQVQLQCGPQKPDSLILFWDCLLYTSPSPRDRG